MTLTPPPELERKINNLVLRGEYPDTEAVLVDAVSALVRQQERRSIESLLGANGMDEGRVNQLLQEAEDEWRLHREDGPGLRGYRARGVSDCKRSQVTLASEGRPAKSPVNTTIV